MELLQSVCKFAQRKNGITMRNIKHIVLHCTASQPTARVRDIQAHWRSIGWTKPGYHIIIANNGEAIRLAPDTETTNGVKGHNSTCIHISYIGGVGRDGKTPLDTRTPAQRATMERLVREYKKKHPNAVVLGHKDFPNVAKACPSFEVDEWLKSIGL